MKYGNLIVVLVAALALSLSAGCAKKPVSETSPDAAADSSRTGAGQTDGDRSGAERRSISESGVSDSAAAEELSLQRIHFDFDQYTLNDQAREELENNAEFMQANPQVDVQIQGHCDERGSDSYNLALGEKRARAAHDYLVTLGISPARLSIISYGEERPLVYGDDEEAWAKNRRAEFVVR